MKLKMKQKTEKTLILNESPKFQHYKTYNDYETAHIKGIEPMTAKEITEDKQDEEFNNPNNFIEEKFDGTRAILHFYKVDPFISKTFKNKLIEDRALTYDLLKGSPYANGKERIYDFFTSNIYDRKTMTNFLKKEYGIGGHSGYPTDEDFEVADNFNSKGLEIIVGSYSNPLFSKLFKWECVADRIKDLIEDGIYYSQKAYTRCFSRRISKQTNWYCENTDSLPHLRDICIPELAGTIIDGEMFIPNRPFKDVSSTLNCLYDKAIERQKELGLIVFHAFDILYYKGRCVEKLPLWKRKKLLDEIIRTVNSPYIVNVTYQSCACGIDVSSYESTHGGIFDVFAGMRKKGIENAYPTFASEMLRKLKENGPYRLSPKALYEYIVATGGEGVILKPKDGKYYHKRGREYQKVKKFLTRELILIGYTEPTKEYTGKFPNNHWDYWLDEEGSRKTFDSVQGMKADKLIELGCTPVTRHYYESQIGQLILGVLITNEELGEIPYNKQGTLYDPEIVGLKVKEGTLLMQVCECSGFDDETRLTLSNNKAYYKGLVVEVKANELFKDTGKMRHPRYLRFRNDKEPKQCTWKDYIGK